MVAGKSAHIPGLQQKDLLGLVAPSPDSLEHVLFQFVGGLTKFVAQ